MNTQRSSRWLLAVGLFLSLALGVFMSARLLRDAQRAQNEQGEARASLIALQSLSDLVRRAGDDQQAVNTVVRRWLDGNPSIVGVRVTDLESRSITATSYKEDLERGEVPRRLVREEKPIFDRGQRISSAVEENREGNSPKPEIEIERNADGSYALAGPVERDGEIVGLVELVRKPATAPAGMAWLPVLAAIGAPLLLFLALSFVIGERRWVLFATALVLLIAAMIAFGRYSSGALVSRAAAIDNQFAQTLSAQADRSRLFITEHNLSATPALDPNAWNTDVFRKPIAATAGRTLIPGQTNALIAITLLCVALLAFVGLGFAARLASGARKHRIALYYIAPAMIGMILLVFFPFFYGIILSFTDQNIYTSNKPLGEIWVFLKNYIEILSQFDVMKRGATGMIWNYQSFYWTLFMTVAWTIVNVTIGVTVGLMLALILNTKGLALKPIYRVLLILPWAVPNYITALIWRGMFHQQFGVVNQIVQMFGGTPIAWFEKPLTSFTAAVATNGWLSFPFMMVISLGALQSISADLYEAARVDGASKWQQFTSITLPSLKPALVPAIILSVVWTFNMFNIIYLVTGGNPAGSTEILITQAYKLAFEQYRYGYAAAYSTIIFMILLVYGTWQNRVTRATEAI